MIIIVSGIALVFLVMVVTLAVLFRRVSPSNGESRLVAPGNVSLTLRYGPMQRLLDEADYRFLSAQPAVAKSVARKMRSQRRVIFRGYLKCLSKDYGRVCSSIRQIMLQSGMDRPELARALFRNRVIFTAALARIEVRLAMHAIGGAKVDVGPLVASLEGMRQHLDSLVNGAGLQPAWQAV